MIPSFFIAHGSPILALENNEYTQFLNQLGKTIEKPEAVIMFSAHWESKIQKVSQVEEYETIPDFYGFPEEMYRIKYPAKGNTKLALEVEKLFKQYGVAYEVDYTRGLDHGAWVVLRMLYPEADIPVISMSVNPESIPEEQYKIGKALAELRKRGLLIIGSGGTVHNLRALRKDKDDGQVDEWAIEFDNWLETRVKNWDIESLFRYKTDAPSASLAVPPHGNEHFIPLFYAMGAADNKQTATLLYRSYRYRNLSHSVWQFG